MTNRQEPPARETGPRQAPAGIRGRAVKPARQPVPGAATVGYLRTIGDDEATGEVADLYRKERERRGYVMNANRVMTTRPEVLVAWERFWSVARGGATLVSRDWRLITLVAATRVPSTYCSLVYGSSLVRDLGSASQVAAVARDFRTAGLSERDVAMLEYAEKVVAAPTTVTEADVGHLRAHGFTDEQIYDVALCASLRCFLSRFYEAVGARPDDEYRTLDPALREPLTVGRPLG